ncbi:MAG: flagellar motor protein MotB [Candidatus Zixiibacteriota bacterium]
MVPKKRIEDQENHERWLLTYADLITLLLAFFIVMYSMSKIDAKRFGKVSEQLSNVLRGGNTILPKGQDFDGAVSGMLRLGELRTIQSQIEQKFSRLLQLSRGNTTGGLQLDQIPADAISTEVGERGLTIHIKDRALFESGKADLKEIAREVLSAVANEIGNIGNHICVEGHTDNMPINTSAFPSNWELSTARATNVVRFLVEDNGLSPERISARGFGEFRPVASNASDKGRNLNRRVDIVILSEDLSLVEPQSNDRVAETIPPIRPELPELEDTIKRVSVEPDKLDR